MTRVRSDRESRAHGRRLHVDRSRAREDHRGGAAGARDHKVMTDGVIDGAPPV
jgi:hypothetical protein